MTISLIISLIAFAVVMGISVILALAQMRRPVLREPVNHHYATFLVQNPASLTLGWLTQLLQQRELSALKLSFEILRKGSSKALAINVPSDMLNYFSGLKVAEIVDYATQITTVPEESLSWQLTAHGDLELHATTNLLANLPLQDSEQLFWQILRLPGGTNALTQINLNVAILAADPARINQLKTWLTERLASVSNLIPLDQPSAAVNQRFINRVGEWPEAFGVNPDQLFQLINA